MVRQEVSWSISALVRGAVRVGDSVIPGRFKSVWSAEAGEREHTVEIEMAVYEGVVVCDSIRILRHPDLPSLTSAEVRRVPVGDYMERATVAVAARSSAGGGRISAVSSESEFQEAKRDARTALRRRITDELLRDVARVYMANLDSTPTKAVKEAFDPIDRSTAERWVREARKRGFITKGGQDGQR